MRNLLFILAVSALGLSGCSASISTNTSTSNSKPANAASNSSSNTAANKPAGNSNSTSSKKTDAPKDKLADEKKPEGKSTKAKENPVPENWVYVYDETKGYGFSVPEGTTGGSQTTSGIDVFVASTPDPGNIGIFVLAYKNKELTKEDLLNDAVKFLEGMGEKVTAGKLTAESDDYSVAEASMVSEDGTKSKAKILVGTDVTDNYVMIVGTDESKFAANSKTIDEIWGSFEMWSGGASGNS